MPQIPECNDTQSFVISQSDTERIFSKLHIRKSPGRVGVPPRLLRHCASELAGVFTFIFNWSLELCRIPKIFKKSVIVPVPKKPQISCHNDYRPVALTSIIMKSFERLVLQFLKSILPQSLDRFQFAYRPNSDDAVSLALHHVLQHLDKRTKTYARLLFIDFSSAFNTILPSKLHTKLQSILDQDGKP